MSWYRWVGLDGHAVGISHFGESAPAAKIFHELGFTPENVVNKARAVLGLEPSLPELEDGLAAAGPTRLGTDERAVAQTAG